MRGFVFYLVTLGWKEDEEQFHFCCFIPCIILFLSFFVQCFIEKKRKVIGTTKERAVDSGQVAQKPPLYSLKSHWLFAMWLSLY
jgi:hypothetical protein